MECLTSARPMLHVDAGKSLPHCVGDLRQRCQKSVSSIDLGPPLLKPRIWGRGGADDPGDYIDFADEIVGFLSTAENLTIWIVLGDRLPDGRARVCMEPGVDVCGAGAQHPFHSGGPSRLRNVCAAVDVDLLAAHRGRLGRRNALCQVHGAVDTRATHRGLDGGADTTSAVTGS
jgi:hypothetical protein